MSTPAGAGTAAGTIAGSAAGAAAGTIAGSAAGSIAGSAAGAIADSLAAVGELPGAPDGSGTSAFGPPEFRRALGHFCTGVVVVTSMDPGPDGTPSPRPVGFACQSFAALSLDPPLILFCPAKSSRTWPAIERAGRFGISVLSSNQQHVSAAFGRSAPDKFAAAPWTLSPGGVPLLRGAAAWLDCTIETVHDAGDHHIIVGRVLALSHDDASDPLLFHRGGYTVTAAPSVPAPGGWMEHFITHGPQGWM